MAFNNVIYEESKIAASAIAQYVVVTPDTTTDNQCFVAGGNTVDAIGVTTATVPTYGYEVPIAVQGWVKCRVAASLGAGARVSVASANGAIGPLAAVGFVGQPSLPIASQIPKYGIGRALNAAAAGDFTTIYLNPREVF